MNHKSDEEDFTLRHLKDTPSLIIDMGECKSHLSHLSAISQGIHYEIFKTLCKIDATKEADTEYFILYFPKSVLKLILIVCTKIRMLCFSLILSGFNTQTVYFFYEPCCSELNNPYSPTYL